MVRKTQIIRDCLGTYLDIIEQVAGDISITREQDQALENLLNIIIDELEIIDADYDEIPDPEGATSRA